MKRELAVIATFLLLGTCAQKDEAPHERRSAPQAISLHGTIISGLLGDARSHNGKEVVVSGKVTAGAVSEAGGERSFMLEDGTGSVLVVTTGDVPGDNQWVTVRGRVAAPYQYDGGRNEVAVVEAQVQ